MVERAQVPDEKLEEKVEKIEEINLIKEIEKPKAKAKKPVKKTQ